MSTFEQLQASFPALARLLAVTGSAGISTYIASYSIAAVPVINASPIDLRVRQFVHAYQIGRDSVPPFAILTSALYIYLAVTNRDITSLKAIPLLSSLPLSALRPSVLYTAAAVATTSIVPYTLLHIIPTTVGPMEVKAEGKPSNLRDEEIPGILKWWQAQNMHRAIMVAIGGLLGGAAILGS